ncbi:MAG: beta-galactosidase, partial [Candidatus Merdousia sp.]|nr:beta-galactosidase [Candidatus Merdousia sp.]
MKKIFLSAFAAAAALSAFAAYEKVEEVEPSLPLPNKQWEEIGRIKHKSAAEIADSRLSVGFECLDRDMFEPEKVYDKLAAIGIKWARCQTGWSKTEKQKGVYDFAWLDSVVDNLIKRGIKPWFNVGFGNPIYMGEMKNPTG